MPYVRRLRQSVSFDARVASAVSECWTRPRTQCATRSQHSRYCSRVEPARGQCGRRSPVLAIGKSDDFPFREVTSRGDPKARRGVRWIKEAGGTSMPER